MTRTGAIAAALLVLLAASARADDRVVWQAHDDAPIPEPAVDDGGDHVWRDGAWSMTVYQLRKVFDPFVSVPALGETLHVALPREAANVNVLDEAPDSTWFTNRHGLRRMSAAALARGPNHAGHAPAAAGPLVILSGKPSGMTAGLVVRDAKGDRYVLKFDPPGYPEVPTGAELVCTKILHALGWNVPENFLVRIEPRRFVIGDDAWIRDERGAKRLLTDADLEALLGTVAYESDGRLRAVASRYLPGIPKGGFRTIGRRADDPDDLVPHEDRRELRGLRIVAAWINYTDARRGNFFDTFVPDAAAGEGRGHLVHYLLDFSSALGAGNDDWKSPRYGHEYYFDPPKALARAVTFGMARPRWADVPLVHPALGYFDADSFDPEEWRTTYPNPLFDAATARDAFWGAKLVSSFTDADLAVLVHAGEWSDPRAATILADLLRRRQRAIARTYFDARHLSPLDGIAVTRGGRLAFRDLAIASGVVPAEAARWRMRSSDSEWTATAPGAPIVLAASPATLEIETSHDGGATWSPPVRATLEGTPERGFRVTALERLTR